MNCIICGNKLIGLQRKYCSKKCKISVANKYHNHWYVNQRNRGLERKKKLIELKGGKCIKCGYDKCYGALTFHHRDPSIKELRLDIRGLSNRSWNKILDEMNKCDLVCFNCHMEIHYGKNGGPSPHLSGEPIVYETIALSKG